MITNLNYREKTKGAILTSRENMSPIGIKPAAYNLCDLSDGTYQMNELYQ